MAQWIETRSNGAKLALAGGRFAVTVSYESRPGVRKAGGPGAFGYRVEVFGSRMAQTFPDLTTAKRKGEEQARKVLGRALDELAAAPTSEGEGAR